jgi:hypothetical protein
MRSSASIVGHHQNRAGDVGKAATALEKGNRERADKIGNAPQCM